MSLKEEQDILFMSTAQNLSNSNLSIQHIQVSAITTEKLNHRLEAVSYTIAQHYIESEHLLKNS